MTTHQRAAFHHDLSRWLGERYGLIAVEELNIKGPSRGRVAGRSAGWNSFFAKLWYKAASFSRLNRKEVVNGTLLPDLRARAAERAVFR